MLYSRNSVAMHSETKLDPQQLTTSFYFTSKGQIPHRHIFHIQTDASLSLHQYVTPLSAGHTVHLFRTITMCLISQVGLSTNSTEAVLVRFWGNRCLDWFFMLELIWIYLWYLCIYSSGCCLIDYKFLGRSLFFDCFIALP